MSEYEPLTDMDIVNLIDQNIGVSVGYYDSELSNERKEVVDYYNAHLPQPAQRPAPGAGNIQVRAQHTHPR